MRAALLAFALVCGCRHDLGPAPDLGPNEDAFLLPGDFAVADGLVCASQSQQVQSIGVDLLLLIDTSYSMDFNLKWESIAQVLKTFVADSRFAGISVGMQYFPLRETCDVDEYAKLAVPFGTLPAAATPLATSLDEQRMAGGTPMVPAMQGVMQVATDQAKKNPGRKAVVVLATDGVPDESCPSKAGGLPNDIASVAQIVKGAAMSTPPIITYVVGVGSGLTALNQIAQAGGGLPTALLVDTTKNVAAEFAVALDSIRRIALTCEFAIPEPQPGLYIEFDRVNVKFTEASEQTLVYVGSQAGCGKAPANGWYYDDPKEPTKVVLCDQACDRVRTAEDGQIDIVYGCATAIP